jgi:hypothetical protein
MGAVLAEADAARQQRHHDGAASHAGETAERSGQDSDEHGLCASRSRQLEPRHPSGAIIPCRGKDGASDRSGDRLYNRHNVVETVAHLIR